MNWIHYIAIAVIAYLLGSVSFGMIVSKMAGGPNLREVGSKNTGATNALRVMGVKYGLAVFVLDILKALAACVLGRLWMGLNGAMLAGLFVVLGHNWPCFFHFQGGKGVASTLAVMLLTFPIPAVICYVVAIVLIATTRFVSLGSITLAVLFAALVIATNWGNWLVIAWVLLIAGLLIARHHANIARLLQGKENKLSFKKRA
ncbi:MAG: glycerol-3-phosphate 1-O-acyltransferase PlsY [Clostridiales bacterium]|nr:glycerol-3-phosphate 1-O-acyltransferase PlsY [Clostridiales bacterium]